MMNQQELRDALARLHEELQQATELDESTRQALTTLQSDIERLISEGEQGGDEGQSADAGLDQRIRESMLQFEARHPRLTSILSQIGDRLADLGI